MHLINQLQTVYKKLTWTWNPGSEKEAGDAIVKNVLLHAFPNKVNKGSL